MTDVWTETAAWVQAVGTIAAVVGAAWVAAGESRAGRRREEQSRREALEREQRSLTASKTAALNLAILATTQIHELHTLLSDVTRRQRVAHMSPSRLLATIERLLIAFPIQSLGDAEAMVAFSYFPGALETAAEIYGNLERAVRGADDDKHGEIFADYAKQMAHLDRVAQRQLGDLQRALGIDPHPIRPAEPDRQGHDTAARGPKMRPFKRAPHEPQPA
ncbi:MAG: hypothetical protein ACHP7N_03130 [Caulobacterales bacterium]